MASQYPYRSYDERTLQALEQALMDVWQVLKAHDCTVDTDEKRSLAFMLMTFAECGVTDPHELRSKALANFRFEAVELKREWRDEAWLTDDATPGASGKRTLAA